MYTKDKQESNRKGWGVAVILATGAGLGIAYSNQSEAISTSTLTTTMDHEVVQVGGWCSEG